MVSKTSKFRDILSLQIVGLALVGRPETQISRASLQRRGEELEGLK